MFIVTAETGEYADKCKYNVFVCRTQEDADTCLRAIDNWFQLRGHNKTVDKHAYMPSDYSRDGVNRERYDTADDFKEQFGVRITIDYTGIEFDIEPVKVYPSEPTT